MSEEILDIDTKTEEEQEGLNGFFKLLLEIDMRNNPELYKNND